MSEELEKLARERKARIRRGWVRVAFLAAAALILVFVVHRWIRFSLESSARLAMEGRLEEAEERLGAARALHPDQPVVQDAMGVISLLSSDRDAAREYFQKALEGKVRSSFDPEEVCRTLTSRGDYAALSTYLDYLKRWHDKDRPFVRYYEAYALNANDRILTAEPLFQGLLKDASYGPPSERHLKLIAFKQRKHIAPFLFDLRERPIAARNIVSDEGLVLAGEIWQPFVGRADWNGGFWHRLSARDRLNKIYTTLDLGVQEAVSKAMGFEPGAFAALDPATGELLACYSYPYLWFQGMPPLRNRPFTDFHPPASASKPFVAAWALRHKALGGVFPFHCTGRFDVPGEPSGKAVFCTVVHGRVGDMNEAIAVSCNGVFAKISASLGGKNLEEMWLQLGIREKTALPPWFGLQAGGVESPASAFEAARLGLGLEHVEVSPLFMAMLVAAAANGGEMMKPRVIARKQNLLDEVYETSAAAPLRRPFSPEEADQIAAWMKFSASSPRGAARGGVPEGLTAAIKTGSYGSLTTGDAWTIGWAPAEKPKIAWALWLGGKGVAPNAAVPATRRLLESLQKSGFFEKKSSEGKKEEKKP
jgi:peptidoglycan glycosyltransferase